MKKRRIFFISISIFSMVAILSTGCESNSKDVLFSNTGCDTSITQYANTIKPILAANCNVCHSTTNAGSLGSGIVLDNYTDVSNWVDTTAGSDLGTLYQDILSGKMPKNAAKLSACETGKIAKWIRNGALNN